MQLATFLSHYPHRNATQPHRHILAHSLRAAASAGPDSSFTRVATGFSAILLLGTILAGCTPAPGQDVAGLPKQPILGLNTSAPNATPDNSAAAPQATPDTAANSASSSATSASDSAQLTTTKGPMVKTIADFPHIAAQEATITTTKGDITFTLFADKAPLTVANFLTLAKSGFYNGIKFHRIIADFMAQVGDPQTKDESLKAVWGTGGPGYTIQDEFSPDLKHDGEGVVSMANTGQPNTGGSQFFITFEATPWLDGHHAVFGKVTKGMDVVHSLVQGEDWIVKVTYK